MGSTVPSQDRVLCWIITAILRDCGGQNVFQLNCRSGTPIQNRVRDMWALMDWVTQGSLLGTQKTFKQSYEDPITRARQRVSLVTEPVNDPDSSFLRFVFENFKA